jgi:uncharacterized protein with PIN domain
MGESGVCLGFDEDLWLFLAPRNRRPGVRVPRDGTSTVGHLVEALGVPLTEVGTLVVGGQPVAPSHRPADGDVVDVRPVARPQRLPVAPVRFVLDVHLGTLTRRLRLVGVDSAYSNDAGDDELIAQANEQNRVLLTQDRGLLRRRSLWLGGYVRGARPDQQLRDVLERFAPPLAPWTICTACNGRLSAVPKPQVEQVLQPGTRRTYESFARCLACGQVYWRGAHSQRLEEFVAAATAALAAVQEAAAQGEDGR